MSILWEKLLRPAMFAFDAERAHEMGIAALRNGLGGVLSTRFDVPASLGPVERFGLQFPNLLGMAAGFDKNGVVVEQLGRLGFGFVEVGTVTNRPQPGNPKPRLFRLPSDRALINRLGFNNDGAEVIAERLTRLRRNCIVGVNIGRNKDVANEDALANYLACLEMVHQAADYLVVNVSSPNTPGLRDLQQTEALAELLAGIQTRNNEMSRPGSPKSLLVKISPDLNDADIEMVADVCLKHGVNGIIATNTTIGRNGLTTPNVERLGAGGVSGSPLRERANDVVRRLYPIANGSMVIIGVGGISTPEDAFDRIAAGASLIQVYTGFVYGGPAFPRRLLSGLAKILSEKGFNHVDEAVGSAA
jgi:dihydroorotate dehydrogenase